MKLQAVIFGLGRIGRIHLENLLTIPKLTSLYTVRYVVEYTDRTSDETKKYLDDNNVKLIDVSEYETILNGLSVAIICTPTNTHYPIIITCLKHRLHVFTEKPISLDLNEINDCYDLADDVDRRLLCAFNRRFDPYIMKLYNYCKLRDDKPNQIITISRDYPYPSADYLSISGGLYQDCIIHDIDIICWTLDEYPTHVSSVGTQTTPNEKNMGNIDHCTTILKFASGTMATIISSRISTSYDQRIQYMFDDGCYYVDNFPESPISFRERYHESYVNELAFLCGHIINEATDITVNKEDCINAYKICEHAKESHESGMTIPIVY
jgi:myo-inositol 2-dehydrogenase / D-chiro-inositol 1-dehydrogenase